MTLRRAPTLLTMLILAAALMLPQSVAAQSGDRAGDRAGELLNAIVNVKAEVPAEARTARFLGTERQGSGVVVDGNGLVLTIGYLILEASGAIVTGADGNQIPAGIVAYDHETGFGLIKARRPLGVEPIRFGRSAELKILDQVLIVSRGGAQPISTAQVVSRRPFAGAWEYLLEKAIFTSPPHAFHSGAALLGPDGKLLGIGSLFVGDSSGLGHPMPGNMFVPIDELKPVFADLLSKGRRAGPYRPWIGANTQEFHSRVIVSRVSPGGPAARAGIEPGDMILGVGGNPVSGQADYFRKLWNSGEAGDTVPLNVLRRDAASLTSEKIDVRSMDRYDWLRMDNSL